MEKSYGRRNGFVEDVWKLVEAPKGSTIVDNKWVYKIKTDADGNVQRYKARLVAKGFTQRQGIDFNKTFSPVVRFDSIRLILTMAVQENLIIKQFDVKTAFLNGEIEESIYMKQPNGFHDGTNRVCKLLKSLYGLRQSSRCWNKKFKIFLLKYGFKESKGDPCLFILIKANKKLIIGLHVDDGIVAANSSESQFLYELQKEFKVTHHDIGTYLGLQVEKRNDGSIFLHQSAYTKKILDKFRMNNTNAVTIPADTHQQLHHVDKSLEPHVPYREAVGSLLYLSIGTRPDIAFAVNKVSRYLENPSKLH